MRKINGRDLKRMIESGAAALTREREALDALNVFPVPDGDTGVNMSMTALSAAKDLPDTNDIGAVAKAAASGSLRGARGNSGVILSQLFRGFAKGLEGVREATVDDLARGFAKASETAYKAVMKPKEGTILTVAHEIGEAARAASLETDDPAELMKEALRHGDIVLKKTREMLPQLKAAGVVDAGGAGFIVMLKGAVARDGVISLDEPRAETREGAAALETAIAAAGDIEIVFGYCTEFFLTPLNDSPQTEPDAVLSELAAYLETIGDSLVVVGDEEIIKIHVHTNNPGLALEKALTYGALSNLKIENMRLQHTSIIEAGAKMAEKKKLAVVSVSVGGGFAALFESLGAGGVEVRVLHGGQTMNPSTEDIAAAADLANADSVIILPNNKNIILAAEQAKYLREDINIRVVPTKSIPQGIAAAMTIIGETDCEAVAGRMEQAMGGVRTGQVTTAVRDSELGGVLISEGDAICMLDGDIVARADNFENAALTALNRGLGEDSGFVTVYYGDGATEETAGELVKTASAAFPDIEFDIQEGGQPIYPYIMSIE